MTTTRKFITEGMHCQGCSKRVEMTLAELPGVVLAVSDHRTGVTEVTFDADVLTDEQVAAEITKTGYTARVA